MYFEMKNCEAFTLGAPLWKTGRVSDFIYKAFDQTDKACGVQWEPVIILAKNLFPPLVVMRTDAACCYRADTGKSIAPFLRTNDFILFPFARMLEGLK